MRVSAKGKRESICAEYILDNIFGLGARPAEAKNPVRVRKLLRRYMQELVSNLLLHGLGERQVEQYTCPIRHEGLRTANLPRRYNSLALRRYSDNGIALVCGVQLMSSRELFIQHVGSICSRLGRRDDAESLGSMPRVTVHTVLLTWVLPRVDAGRPVRPRRKVDWL